MPAQASSKLFQKVRLRVFTQASSSLHGVLPSTPHVVKAQSEGDARSEQFARLQAITKQQLITEVLTANCRWNSKHPKAQASQSPKRLLALPVNAGDLMSSKVMQNLHHRWHGQNPITNKKRNISGPDVAAKSHKHKDPYSIV